MGNQTSSGAPPLPGHSAVQPQRKYTNPTPTDRVTAHGRVFLKPQVVDQRYDNDQIKVSELPGITALRSRMGHPHSTAHPQWSEYVQDLEDHTKPVSQDPFGDGDDMPILGGPRLGPNA
jgi:hypothetical protein